MLRLKIERDRERRPAGMWFSVASHRPGPNPPPYQRSSLRWSPAVCSPRASCSLGETVGCSEQDSSSMVMRNAADPRLSTPLKGRHESPNFRTFYLVEPHRHLCPTSKSQ